MMTSELVFSSLVIRTPLSKAATAEVLLSDESEDEELKGPRELLEPLALDPLGPPPRRDDDLEELLRRLRLLDREDDELLLEVEERLLST